MSEVRNVVERNGLTWKEYVSKTIKDEEVWAYAGDDSIELRPGFGKVTQRGMKATRSGTVVMRI